MPTSLWPWTIQKVPNSGTIQGIKRTCSNPFWTRQPPASCLGPFWPTVPRDLKGTKWVQRLSGPQGNQRELAETQGLKDVQRLGTTRKVTTFAQQITATSNYQLGVCAFGLPSASSFQCRTVGNRHVLTEVRNPGCTIVVSASTVPNEAS